MTVRAGAKTAAGNPLTADDLIYKIQRALGLNAGSVFDFNILGLTKPDQVTKVNDSTIKIKLPTASPILGPMLRDQDAGLVDSTILKQHTTTADPWSHAWLAQNGTADTGAYQISQDVPGQKIVLTANPNYWGPKPYFQTVVLQVIPSAQTRILLLENGSIDIAEDLSLNDTLQMKGKSGVKIVSAPTVDQDLLGFVQDKKPFNDLRVRQAIAYAVPYKQLVSGVLKGQAKVAKGVWPENSIWFKNAPWPYKLDVAKAKALLKAAGYAKGLSFTVEISTADADAQALAIPLQTALKNVGVTMNIKTLSAAQFQGDLGKKSMQAWIESNLGSYVDDPYYQTYLWYGTKSVLNWFKFSNPIVDAATKQFATVLTPAKKNALALQVQQQLNKNVPLISLGEPNFVMAMRSDIKGFLYEPDGLLTYRYFSRS
jgi:peptide/nickel transport system substrate-binding protein